MSELNRILTGKTRFRVYADKGNVLLVLQVEYRVGCSPLYGWRDATLEDISESKTRVEISK